MEETIIKMPEGRDLKFTGKLIAEAKESDNSGSSNYSGSSGRWAEFFLYQTQAGKYVGIINYNTRWQGESDSVKYCVSTIKAEIMDFFGDGWLAKQIYEEAGWDFYQEID